MNADRPGADGPVLGTGRVDAVDPLPTSGRPATMPGPVR
jgi:hypothetical protein